MMGELMGECLGHLGWLKLSNEDALRRRYIHPYGLRSINLWQAVNREPFLLGDVLESSPQARTIGSVQQRNGDFGEWRAIGLRNVKYGTGPEIEHPSGHGQRE